jgi:hypothetical protein
MYTEGIPAMTSTQLRSRDPKGSWHFLRISTEKRKRRTPEYCKKLRT